MLLPNGLPKKKKISPMFQVERWTYGRKLHLSVTVHKLASSSETRHHRDRGFRCQRRSRRSVFNDFSSNLFCRVRYHIL